MTASLDEYLKNTALFSAFDDRQIAGVLSVAKERRFAAGAPIIRQGESGLGFYLLVEGHTEVRSGETVLARLGPGDYCGEMALLLPDAARTADVVAVEDTTCLVITQWAFKSLLAAHPEMAAALMAELARRLRETSRTLSE